MAVTITTIQPQDSIASSRLTLNSNFSSLKAGINLLRKKKSPIANALKVSQACFYICFYRSVNASLFYLL